MPSSHRRRADDLFRTRIPITPSSRPLDWRQGILCLGSCFAGEIGQRLRLAGLSVVENPMGVLYNPASLASCLQRLVEGRSFGTGELVQHNGLWFSPEADTHFSHPDREACLGQLNEAVTGAHRRLPGTGLLLLTLGTARVWRRKATGEIVANCHRLPGRDFEREVLDVSQVCELLEAPLRAVLDAVPGLQVLLSVSPVRHLREDPRGNTLSKAILHLGLRELEERDERLKYFPAWELLQDELRDYRYYGEDLVHPAPVAVEYIFRRFAEAWLDEDTRNAVDEVTAIRIGLEHRPRHPASGEYKRFLEDLGRRLETASRSWPGIRTEDMEEKRQSLLDLHHRSGSLEKGKT